MKLNPCAAALVGLVVASASPVLAADIRVPTDHATIQAAVDAAVSGDTIHIAPGVYAEQTWITDKDLTLIGQPGTILRAFPGMAPALPGTVNERCILFISEFSEVTLRNLCFEGDQLADQNAPALLGVIFDVSGGSVENCRFTSFREKQPGAARGQAIWFWNGLADAPLYRANVSGTTIVDSYSGIEINGAEGAPSYDVTVLDNTITGVGLTTAADFLQGLHLGDGTIGKVARNTISGFAFDGAIGPGAHPIPFGILRLSSGFPLNTRALAPMIFEANVLRSNQVHLAFFKADDSVVRNNSFEGHLPFAENPPRLGATAGLWFSGANVQVVGNQFRDLEQGIRLAGGDPFAVATNAMLIDNRFCDVDTSVVIELSADATEQGSLTCPFPDPVLDITRAVLLSWPEIEEGFSVECAPTSEGPWTVVDALTFLQDGSHTVSVRTDGDQKFFRLHKP